MQGAGAALTGLLFASNQAFQSGEFHNILNTLPHIPSWVPFALAVLAFLTFLAHGRNPNA